MIQVLGWRTLLLVIIGFTILLGLVRFVFNQPDNMIEFITLFSGVGGILTLLLFTIGQSPAFPWLLKRRPFRGFLPDIDGNWSGSISSNWATIAEKQCIRDANDEPFLDKDIEVSATILVRLFTVSLKLVSASKYQRSKTVVCQLQRNDHGDFILAYVYRSEVPDYQPSDEQGFLGAGHIEFSEMMPANLTGQYWTNRKWKEGQNTAGIIRLWRPEQSLRENTNARNCR